MTSAIREVVFVKSSQDESGCPTDEKPEYAFVGRSNVGKSSLINYITGQRKLAKTSGQPGRTRLINHFLVNNSWYLVDLPGYGYAKIGKTQRSQLIEIIRDYLSKRKNLACLFLLIDCRHEPQKIDLEFIQWLGGNGVPFVICFTKTDKRSASQLQKSVQQYRQTLLENWESLPQIFLSSTLDHSGKEEILDLIQRTNTNLQI